MPPNRVATGALGLTLWANSTYLNAGRSAFVEAFGATDVNKIVTGGYRCCRYLRRCLLLLSLLCPSVAVQSSVAVAVVAAVVVLLCNGIRQWDSPRECAVILS